MFSTKKKILSTQYSVLSTLLSLLLLSSLAKCDSIITGSFVDQHPTPVVHPDIWNAATWTNQFFSPSSLVQYPDGRMDLLTSIGWTWVPSDLLWLTEAGIFTGRLTDSSFFLAQGDHQLSWNLADLPIYPGVLMVTPGSLNPTLTAEGFTLDYQGFVLSKGTFSVDESSLSTKYSVLSTLLFLSLLISWIHCRRRFQ